MKNKLLTTVILSVLAVSLVLSTGIYALVADDEFAPPETSVLEILSPETLAPETLAPETLAPETLAPETLAPEASNSEASTYDTSKSMQELFSDGVLKTLDDINDFFTSCSEDDALREDYIEYIYQTYCGERGGEVKFIDTDGKDGPGVNYWPWDNKDDVRICSYRVIVPECYGRPGEDRPIEVLIKINEENTLDSYKWIDIPYDEIDPELKQAVTLGYRRYQEILDGGKMVSLYEDFQERKYGLQDSGFYPSAKAVVDNNDEVFQGKVVGISFEAKEHFEWDGEDITCFKTLFTIYEVELANSYKGSTGEHVKIRVKGGHPTYGLDKQRKAMDEVGLSMYDIQQCDPEHVLNLNETYIFATDVVCGISCIPDNDWSEAVFYPETDIKMGWDWHSSPFAFKVSEPSENGTMAAGNPNGEANYENILAYINSKSNEVDK